MNTYKEIIIMVNKKKYTHMEKGRAADRGCIRRHRQHVTLQRKCKNESEKQLLPEPVQNPRIKYKINTRMHTQ